MRTLTLLLTCVSTAVAASISTPYEVLPPGQLSSVIVAKDATVESSVNAEQLLPPASTLKLVTALAAKLHWKEGHQFSTQLLQQGKSNLDSPWIVGSVVTAIVGVLVMVTFIGEAIRTAFDPKKYTVYR